MNAIRFLQTLALTAAALTAQVESQQPKHAAPPASARNAVLKPPAGAKLDKVTKQELRAQHRLNTLKTGDKKYDPADLLKAKDQRKAMRVSPAAWPRSQPVPAGSLVAPLAAGIQPSGWTALGPRNIGGRTRSLCPHPTDPNLLYAGAVSGGIWKTVNGGATWTPLNDFLPSLIVGAMAMDRTNPGILYAGTGEQQRGAGVFKTTNGGLNWNLLPSTAGWYAVKRIVLNPTNNQVLLAAVDGGIYRSTNGGTTFTHVIAEGSYDVDFHPTEGSKAWATTSDRGVLYSLDGGVNWTQSTGLPTGSRIEVAVAKSNPNIVYASVDVNIGEMYRSNDGGRSFTLRNTGTELMTNNQGWWANALWVDPTNSERLLWGGVDMYRSLDGGSSWEQVSGSYLHADQHLIVEAYGYSATNRGVWVTNDGGIYRTSDFLNITTTAPWESKNTDYSVTQFYSGAGNVANGMIMGGTQDNGTPRYAGVSNDWTSVGCCDGTYMAADPIRDPDGSSYFYGGSQSGDNWRAKMRPDGSTESADYLNGPGQNTDTYEFIHPLALDNRSPQRLYKAGLLLWRLDNPRTAALDAPWVQVAPAAPNKTSTIAVAPSNSEVIWTGHVDGMVRMTSNGLATNPTWAQRGEGVLPLYWITDIAIDPTNTNRVYVTYGGFGPDNVWKTEDAGLTWTDITANLPDVVVRSLVVNPFNTNFIYIGTEIGIFASENRGGNWSPSNDGPANVPTDELFWMGNRLVAATHGRGMFRITVNTPPTVSLTAPANNQTFAAGSNITLSANAADADGSVTQVEFFHGLTNSIGTGAGSPWSVVWNNIPAGTYSLTARATDNDGGVRVSAAINITVTGAPATFRNPMADSYVRNGAAYVNSNFGTATPLSVKTNTMADVNRDAYLRFDVSGLGGFLGNAKLRAFGKLSDAGTVNVAAHSVATNTWAENTITWNNKPAMGPVLATRSLTGTTDAWHEWDVTAFVRKERARGQASLSLGLHGTASVNPLTSFHSREAVAANRPQLTYSLTSPQALFVVGSATLSTGDAAVRTRLLNMGFTVVVKDAASATTGDATGKALVLVSATVTSSAVGNKYRMVAVPVVNCEQAIQDDMAMTGTPSTEYGTVANQTQVKILNASHPLAGGLTGTVTVSTSAQTFNFGRPSANAVKVGSIPANDTQVSVYGYETGVAMVGMNAPARRVNLYLGDATPKASNDAGWSLFDAAVYWVSGF